MLTPKDEEKIAETLQTLLAERNIESISMEEVAGTAKVSPEKIRSQFNSVADIVRYLLAKGIDESSRLFLKIVEERGKPDVKIERLVRRLLSKYETYFPLYRVLSFDAPGNTNAQLSGLLTLEQIERYRQNTAIIARLIAEGQSQRLFAPIEPLEAAYLLRGLINASVGYWQYAKKGRSLASRAQPVLRVFLKGLYK
jgi:AcrR family transcriptional regulator